MMKQQLKRYWRAIWPYALGYTTSTAFVYFVMDALHSWQAWVLYAIIVVGLTVTFELWYAYITKGL